MSESKIIQNILKEAEKVGLLWLSGSDGVLKELWACDIIHWYVQYVSWQILGVK